MSTFNEFLQKDLAGVFSGIAAGALIGAVTAIAMKGVLGVFAVSLLTGSYPRVALLGVKIFASMLGGAAVAGIIQKKLSAPTVDDKGPSTWVCFCGAALAVIPVVWLSAIPVTTALALAALSIAFSALTLPFGKYKGTAEAFMPVALGKSIYENLPLIAVTGVVCGTIGAVTAVIAKIALQALSMGAFLPGGYGAVAVAGAAIVGVFMAGTGIVVQESLDENKEERIDLRSLAIGSLVSVPVIALTGVPVITAVALIAINFLISASPAIWKRDITNAELYVPYIIGSKI